MSCLPTGVEPVKVNFLTVGLPVNSAPISAVLPANMLITPAGIPARSANSAQANAESGVALAGLQTTVHPAANAGAIFRVSIALGKFHGVMHATTPIGCLIHIKRLSLDGSGIVSP